MSSILLAEDSQELREIIKKTLSRMGYSVVTVKDGNEAAQELKKNFFDLLLTDIRMAGLDGMDLLKLVKELSPDTNVILMTGFGTIENAVEAMRQGATDYLLKPFSMKEIEFRIQRIFSQRQLALEYQDLKNTMRSQMDAMIGNSPVMQHIRGMIGKVAPSQAHVLILGETGTGKEIVACAIHQKSPQATRPFVTVNCVALASGVLESELFGHEKGSFTGALKRRMGKFEIADGGTIFLDEIGELDHMTQAKLLRFLQEKEFERVGGNEKIKVDVRIIAATNRDLEKEIAEGRFRKDLFYRLDMFSINLPPLKDRGNDLFELAEYFLKKSCREIGKQVDFTSETRALLANHSWPGNIRELQNVITEAVILSEDKALKPEWFPSIFAGTKKAVPDLHPSAPLSEELHTLERERIRIALKESGWNQVHAAEKLGLKRSTLQYKMKHYHLVPPGKAAIQTH